MAVLTQRMTEAEFMRMPDDGYRYELVDGEPKRMSTNWKHDLVGGNIYDAIRPYTKKRGYMSMGQAGFRMVSSNVRNPDVSFTLKERVANQEIFDGFGPFSPDLCIEVISPSEEAADMARKVREYFASGAQIVWQMFSETETIKVYTSPDDFTLYTAQMEIDCPSLLPGFRIQVAELFAPE